MANNQREQFWSRSFLQETRWPLSGSVCLRARKQHEAALGFKVDNVGARAKGILAKPGVTLGP